MLKVIFKTIVLLGILFVVLYVGMKNPDPIKFYFPIPEVNGEKPISASAAVIYFGFFAIGLLAGAVLFAGGGKGGGKKAGAGGKEK